MSLIRVLLPFYLVLLGQSIYGYRDTGLLAMEAFLHTQKTVTEDLERRVSQEIARVKTLKRLFNLFKQQKRDIEENPQYIQNPINAFVLVKRLAVDLRMIVNMLNEDRKKWKWKLNLKYPTSPNLEEAVYWIWLLQSTYRLNATQLANGTLVGKFTRNGKKYIEQTSRLTTSDCYKLAHGLYQMEKFKIGVHWMEEVYRKYKAGDNAGYPFTSDDILYDIIFAYRAIGDDENGLKWAQILVQNNGGADKFITRRILKSSVQLQMALYSEITGLSDFGVNPASFEKFPKQIVEHFQARLKARKLERSNQVPTDEVSSHQTPDDVWEDFTRLCRGEMELPNSVKKRLKCRYLKETHPFLKLAPLKLEELYLDPDVSLVYDAITDEEMEHLKTRAKPFLSRAGTVDNDGKYEFKLERLTDVAWAVPGDYDHVVLKRLSHRVIHFTGLNEQSMEQLQIANYGIGGWYYLHNDYPTKMSDVAQGGATVFQVLGLSVYPVKGAALVWTNLFPSGEGNLALFHGACPVLRGSKWVASQWMRQQGLELIRPCSLEYQEEGFHREFPWPVYKTPKL